MAKNKITRMLPLDALRGLIIILMAIDHANEFIAHQHSSGEFWGGSLPHFRDTLSFLTRFVTHLSAPGFFFLMGVGMLLFANSRRKNGWGEWAITRHFILRGIVLIAFQFLLENQAWELSLSPATGRPPGIPSSSPITYYGVLYALGGTMILGSLLLRLKPWTLFELTIIFVLGSEFFTPIPEMVLHEFHPLTRLLLVPGFSSAILVYYPILPWLKLVLFGMLFAHWLKEDAKIAYRRAWKIGAGFLVGFFILRAANGFGNVQTRPGNNWIAFLNVVKYPPSLTFTLLTMGLNLLILGWFGAIKDKLGKYLQPLIIFGRVPLFFYLSHLYIFAGIGLLIGAAGTSLAGMYPYWLIGLIILLPLCWGYGWLKQRQSPKSILRFL